MAGTGTGAVAGAGGISCPGTCIATFPSGTSETLSAVAASGSVFSGWSGGVCTGTGSCQVTLSAPVTVTAVFTAMPSLSINILGPGSGTVTGKGIACPGGCSANYADGTVVTLTAVANSKSAFGGWSGAGCSGTSTCTVTVTEDTTVTATFTPTDTGSLKPISPVSLPSGKQPLLKFGSNGKGSVPISCGGTLCSGKVAVSLDESGRSVTVASARFKIRGRRKKSVVLQLKRAVQMALSALPHHSATATLTITTTTRQTAVETVKLSVAKPRSVKKRKHKR
jgi:hypothetical protein